MYRFKEIGHSTIWFVGSIRIFFRFLGHFFSSFFHCLTGPQSIGWSNFISTLYQSGAHLLLPIVIISGLLGVSISLSLFSILNEIGRGSNALPISQNIAINNLAPLLIGIMLSIQSSLNLINANIHKLHHTPDEVMCEFIIPISISLFVNGLSLYIYSLLTFLVTIYSTFQYIINMDTRDTLLHLASIVSIYDIIYSIFKLFIFCCIITLVLGYYYYEISIRKISLRTAVSRVMTRCLFFIILFGAYLNIFHD
ncbi:ABC transporter permease [Legionella impletisoli]|uniref:ABC transporter permease n=1 Tax=Legionella impletisoli TaxID=343510 RepID=A0A917JPK5_9GAMM|nr:ABC transporter permease [Legionella impletisoli]GGI80451.1 ABC transporter permease [Legionella impletisoli]